MAWSTSELAKLAGTTVNTIRHYHRLGLLEEPDRRNNGYKQYGVRDLVCLLRIRRLAELGVPLSQIHAVSADTADALRRVDADHVAAIERLERARQDIAAILHDNAPADAPAGFASVASRMSEADQSMVHLYSQVYDDDTMADIRRMVEQGKDAADEALDALPADADEATRQNLAEKLAPGIATIIVDYPWVRDPAARLSRNAGPVDAQTFVDAMTGLYNPAQADVLVRAALLAYQQLGPHPRA